MWSKVPDGETVGIAIWNYKGEEPHSIALDIGDCVHITHKAEGWYRGHAAKNKSSLGVYPASHIRLKSSHGGSHAPPRNSIMAEDFTVKEVASVLREWSAIWKRLYLQRETQKFETFRNVMNELFSLRRQLIGGTLTQDQIKELKLTITTKIDWGNKLVDGVSVRCDRFIELVGISHACFVNRELGLDMVPREEAEGIDPEQMSVIDLYNVLRHASPRRRRTKKPSSYHLYFELRDFSYAVAEDQELYFSLYDAKEAVFISERFLVKIPKTNENSYFIEKISEKWRTIFIDLGMSDLTRELYMIVHVIRVGRLLPSESSKKPTSHFYRRPVGCAAFSIAEIRNPASRDSETAPEELEFTPRLFQCEEKDFHQLHEMIIKGHHNKYTPLTSQPQFASLVVALELLQGDLSQLKAEKPLFKNVPSTRKMGFPDVIMPGDVRNDLYLTLERADFEKGGKSISKNIEVKIQVLNNQTGDPLKGCFHAGASLEPQDAYHSLVFYHFNAPQWNETIRLDVPIEKFTSSHLRLEYYHCSTRDKNEKKLIGFSYLRLVDEEGRTIQDKSHSLSVFRCDDILRIANVAAYLSQSSEEEKVGREAEDKRKANGLLIRSGKERVHIKTLLCSTKLTQNVDLLALLKWKNNQENLSQVLEQVKRLDGEELVKFLQDILDALFSMFATEDGRSTENSGRVFENLVHIFNMLERAKYEHFKPVLDAYIRDHFAAVLVWKGLIACLQCAAKMVLTSDKQDEPKRAFITLDYIFKFIVQSCILYKKHGGQGNDNFTAEIVQLFQAFQSIFSTTYSEVLKTQVTFLTRMSCIFEQLMALLPSDQIAKWACAMFESLPFEPPDALVDAKLTAIHETLNSKLFEDQDARSILIDTVSKHIRDHLSNREQLEKALAVLSLILSSLHRVKSAPVSQESNRLHSDISRLSIRLLDVLFWCLAERERTSPLSGSLLSCLLGLLGLMDQSHHDELWEHLDKPKSRKDFLRRSLDVFLSLVQLEIYPADWLVMRMVTLRVILECLDRFVDPMVKTFLDPMHFDSSLSFSGEDFKNLFQLWMGYLQLGVAYVTQPALQLEKFSEMKREKILHTYGDMRIPMGHQLLSIWSKLDNHKIEFVPQMVGPILEVTLIPEQGLRKDFLPVFIDMMDCEFNIKGTKQQVENELIDKLDILVGENKGDDNYRRLFHSILVRELNERAPVWKKSGLEYVTSVTKLLERLLDYRNVNQGHENRDKRMSCIVSLLNFYQKIDHQEMYLRYIYKLHEMHREMENYTEAALTLMLHAKLLGWSQKVLHSDLLYPVQQELQRKEEIYNKIIDFLDRGKCWEKAIPLCEELALLYKEKYDYEKLSALLRTQAQFYKNILTELRAEPEYFRVCFYGKGFPAFLREKVFVYRGLEYERLQSFIQRMQMEFPAAQFLQKNTAPDDSIHILTCNVKPIPKPAPFDNEAVENVPDFVKNFYLVNDVDKFQFDRPFHKGPINKGNEFKTMWLERTTMKIESSLPGILKRFEVTRSSMEEICPVRFACETIYSANDELRQLIQQYKGPEANSNPQPLTMRLTIHFQFYFMTVNVSQGILDAAVQGGIAKYQEAFFVPEFVNEHPEYRENLLQLNRLIKDQMRILDNGLQLHGRLALASGLQGLHKHLVENFGQIQSAVRNIEIFFSESSVSGRQTRRTRSEASNLQRTASIVNTPLPPVPQEYPCDNISLSSCDGTSVSSLHSSYLEGLNSDEDQHYCRPPEWNGSRTLGVPGRQSASTLSLPPPPPLPPRPPSGHLLHNGTISPPSRSPRSSLNQDHPDYVTLANRDLTGPSQALHPFGRASSNHWSEDDAPPLPPRGSVSALHEVRLRVSPTPSCGRDTPPIRPPKPAHKTTSLTSRLSDVSSSGADTSFDSSSPTHPSSPIPIASSSPVQRKWTGTDTDKDKSHKPLDTVEVVSKSDIPDGIAILSHTLTMCSVSTGPGKEMASSMPLRHEALHHHRNDDDSAAIPVHSIK
ncbi:unnamed protein product, partial [Darwinula stevensoni]